MRGMKGALLALVCIASATFGGELRAESIQDYAFGETLDAPGHSPWYRLALPEAVYRQATSGDLRDVRVFDRQGESVPFSLELRKVTPPVNAPVALRIFPMDISPVPGAVMDDVWTGRLLLQSKNGVEIRLEGEMVDGLGSSYLLALPESLAEMTDIRQLQFTWEKPQSSWQGRVSIWAINNPERSQTWYSLKEDVPLMDLRSGDDRLKIDRIQLNATLSRDGTRYLLLNVKGKAPRLTGVSAVPGEEEARVAPVSITPDARRVSDKEAIWSWARPQPLTALQIALAEEGTLPVIVAWRPDADAAWQTLTRTLIYQLNGQASGTIAMSGQRVQAIRMVPISARLPAVLPKVLGLRDGYQLIFNAQGKGPYILAWGNGAARPASLPLDELIPESLRQSHDIEALPEAAPVAPVTLGGEARLGATSEEAQRSRWQTLLVWAILITGVLALAGMAWRLWREAKSGASSH
ncbi:DUF3999 family protein [Pluralibacter gergoviae]|uniref:DUF3999 family protein n=1 Tax=Pluralibacter gergoviae TaxID=61647 RepID=A0AAW8HP34_PLUGE|nr:DUF3999 family protein [Pluralibacter gergoviae]AVR03084.1 DUF3999 domain-containing protein [Pluralibacter gergoviae]MDQ2310212.1 DUF3999 family protein [Pluralibacter gergoviae]